MASKGRNISKLEVDASGIVSADSLSSIVDAAPATLDTLNELAAALGDDANFASTVTNTLSTKVSKSGDTMTGDLTVNGYVYGQDGSFSSSMFVQDGADYSGMYATTLISSAGGTSTNITGGNANFGGNVGIGTSSPSAKLTVASGSNTTGVGNGIDFYGSSANNQASIWSYNAGAYDGDLRFYTSKHSGASPSMGAERMRIDASGRVTIPYQPAFSATVSGSNPLPGGGLQKSIYNVTKYNTGNAYNVSTGAFTAPTSGYYYTWQNLDLLNPSSVVLYIYKNGSVEKADEMIAGNSGWWNYKHSDIIYLNTGDYIEFYRNGSWSNSATNQWMRAGCHLLN